MIPDYKVYHGAVLAELIDEAGGALSIRELVDEGRLSSYVVNERIGFYVKHSAARMPPWQFTFTAGNRRALQELRRAAQQVFVVLVCWLDGMVCLSEDELRLVLGDADDQQGWVRIERRKYEWYAVSGGYGELPHKKPDGISVLIAALREPYTAT